MRPAPYTQRFLTDLCVSPNRPINLEWQTKGPEPTLKFEALVQVGAIAVNVEAWFAGVSSTVRSES